MYAELFSVKKWSSRPFRNQLFVVVMVWRSSDVIIGVAIVVSTTGVTTLVLP